MKQNNNLWKFLFVVFIICWSFFQMYPPTSRDLVKEFASRSENHDASFSNILARVDELQRAGTNSEFANLRAAIGTNSIVPYFNFSDATNENDPTTFILNRLQREASGKIKLGLDLKGGSAFLVEMDTNALPPVPPTVIRTPSSAKRTPPARFRRRSRCCASAWTSSAWPSRSSSRRVRTRF